MAGIKIFLFISPFKKKPSPFHPKCTDINVSFQRQ